MLKKMLKKMFLITLITLLMVSSVFALNIESSPSTTYQKKQMVEKAINSMFGLQEVEFHCRAIRMKAVLTSIFRGNYANVGEIKKEIMVFNCDKTYSDIIQELKWIKKARQTRVPLMKAGYTPVSYQRKES